MVGPCVEKSGESTFKPSHFHEGLGPGEREVQDLRQQRRGRRLLQLVRRGHHGQGPQPLLRRETEEARPA